MAYICVKHHFMKGALKMTYSISLFPLFHCSIFIQHDWRKESIEKKKKYDVKI